MWLPSMQGLGKAEVHELRSHLNDLSRDNAILKRAVAIQNSRMQVDYWMQAPNTHSLIASKMRVLICCAMHYGEPVHKVSSLQKYRMFSSSGPEVDCQLRCQDCVCTFSNRRQRLTLAVQEAVHSKESEVAVLRSALQQYEQKVKALELTNYSLSMHLRQATESNHSFNMSRDVY